VGKYKNNQKQYSWCEARLLGSPALIWPGKQSQKKKKTVAHILSEMLGCIRKLSVAHAQSHHNTRAYVITASSLKT
jgi:hypothetical protein